MGGRAAESKGGEFGIQFAGPEHVHRDGEHGGIVLVGGTHHDTSLLLASGRATGAPELRATIARRDDYADEDGESEAQARDGDAMVLQDGAPLARVGGDAGGIVGELDESFDLVAILASWPAATTATLGALAEQFVDGQGGGMGRGQEQGLVDG